MDVERTIEFLLQQQARFDERQQKHDERQAKFEEDMLQINAILLDFAATQERTNEIVAVLAERQVKTEELLQSLITTVEQHIAGHN